MRKAIILIFGMLLLLSSGCIKHKEVKYIDYHYITNTIGKRIVHEIPCNPQYVIGKDTFQFFSSGATHQTELEWIITAVYSDYREAAYGQYGYIHIYCIDDTTSIRWSALWGNEMLPANGCNQYFCYISKGDVTTNREIIWMSELYLTVNDSLLLSLQKDYTMLEKFPEYYKKE